MSIDLERRVENLEKEIDDLKRSFGCARVEKDWRRTFGMSRDDAGFEEMVRLGREIRERDRIESSK